MKWFQCLLALSVLSGVAAAEDRIRLGLFSAMPVKWDVAANWRTFEETLERHAGQRCDLIVTPECFLDGYAVADKNWSRERFEGIAQDPDGSPYLIRLRELARKHRAWILFGYTERRQDKFYNAAVLVDREGRHAGRYYKTHLQEHDLRFAPGEDLPVFETPWGKVGVLICADRRWPEAARVLRLRGARLTLIPSYGMWHLDNEWWMRTRAYENENFLAFAHPNVAFVADPKGAIVARLQSNVPGILVCDLDLSQVTESRHLRDRRPELYKDIAGPRQR
ncbi:MAG: carbon-nitrogen hydrolase family protein [Acidobacteriota bacterium]